MRTQAQIPSIHRKSQHGRPILYSSTRETERWRSLGVFQSANLANLVRQRFNERSSLKKYYRKWLRKTPESKLQLPRTHAHFTKIQSDVHNFLPRKRQNVVCCEKQESCSSWLLENSKSQRSVSFWSLTQKIISQNPKSVQGTTFIILPY